MTPRKVLFWIHLCIGVTAGLVIFTMSVTGVMLVFERQIVAWTDRGYRHAPAPGEQRLPIDVLLAKVQAAQGAAPSGILLRSEPALPIEFNFGRERTVLVDPYSGAILVDGSSSRAFFAQVENVHRWLAMPEEKRALGEGITGACNLAFLGLLLTGPFLWWPKEWTWVTVKKVLVFRNAGNFRATLWNWHNVFGIWCVAPLFFIVITGAVMSYPWANDLLYRMTGNQPPPRQQRLSPGQRPAGGREAERQARGGAGDRADAPHPMALDDLFARAENQTPDWKSVTLRMNSSPHGPLTFFLDRGPGGRPDLRSQLTLNSETGEIIRWERLEDYNLGRRLRTWGRFTHTGEAGGVIGQVIAALAATGASILVFSGFCLAIRRLVVWKSRIWN